VFHYKEVRVGYENDRTPCNFIICTYADVCNLRIWADVQLVKKIAHKKAPEGAFLMKEI